jgi:hypothetical protein
VTVDHDVAREVHQPRAVGGVGVGGLDADRAARPEQFTARGVGVEHLRQPAELHPLREPVEGEVLGDRDVEAERQRAVGAVHERLVGEAAREEPRALLGQRGPHGCVGAGLAERLRERLPGRGEARAPLLGGHNERADGCKGVA